eukprot:IDg12874t1
MRLGLEVSTELWGAIIDQDGKRGSSLSDGHTERIIEIREIAKEYRLSDVYNKDKTVFIQKGAIEIFPGSRRVSF